MIIESITNLSFKGYLLHYNNFYDSWILSHNNIGVIGCYNDYNLIYAISDMIYG